MTSADRATKINLLDFHSPQMRAFHMAWFAFFLCFFGWFGIAPLMPIIRDELHLSKAQIGNSIIASVAITILARLVIGWMCDHFGPRRSYTALLLVGSLPVMGVGLAHDYSSFLLFRLAIGMIGAAFVITQYHTTIMFAPKIVGTANATAAGWGNLGGGVTQVVMPMIFGAFLSMGLAAWASWRLSMVVCGIALLLTGIAYYFLTQDTPSGDWKDRPKNTRSSANKAFAEALKDRRVWALALIYGGCFGIELTIDNVAALYFVDNFKLKMAAAGAVAGSFGMMNLFARALGGFVSDKAAARFGLSGRSRLLGITLFCEGLALMVFSHQHLLVLAVASMMLTGLFVKMSNGATYSLTPFINPKGVGAVAGIVGAGGNLGAVLAGFLFKTPRISWPDAITILGVLVVAISSLSLLIRFPATAEDRSSQTVPLTATTGLADVTAS
jgi:NNP family nitrate/nitrite transporter-like MFS transporter